MLLFLLRFTAVNHNFSSDRPHPLLRPHRSGIPHYQPSAEDFVLRRRAAFYGCHNPVDRGFRTFPRGLIIGSQPGNNLAGQNTVIVSDHGQILRQAESLIIGGLIDAEALLEGIKARKIGAACLDVYEEEADVFFEDRSGHIMDDELLSRLISMPNVIVTSHQAFLTEEALNNIAETTVNNILSCFRNDGMCDNELCYRCGKIEQCRKERKQKCF